MKILIKYVFIFLLLLASCYKEPPKIQNNTNIKHNESNNNEMLIIDKKLQLNPSIYYWKIDTPVYSNSKLSGNIVGYTSNVLEVLGESEKENIYKIVYNKSIGYVDLSFVTDDYIKKNIEKFKEYESEVKWYQSNRVKRVAMKLYIIKDKKTILFMNTFDNYTQERYLFTGFVDDSLVMIQKRLFEGSSYFYYNMVTDEVVNDVYSLPIYNSTKTHMVTYGTTYVVPMYSIFRVLDGKYKIIKTDRIDLGIIDGKVFNYSETDNIEWIDENTLEINKTDFNLIIRIDGNGDWKWKL